MLGFLPLAGGVFLGWSLGANDASNVFGTAVASRVVPFRKACILCSLAIIAGALVQGQAGFKTLGSLTAGFDISSLVVVSVTAAITVTVMTLASLPVSTSQAIVGAITGISISMGDINYALLGKVVLCWIATPIAAMVIAVILYVVLGLIMRSIPMSILTRDKTFWSLLIIVGTYGSYALGANNVANATGIYANMPGVSNDWLVAIGGLSIAFGVITYSKRVMYAVGSGIMPLDAFTSLVAVSAMSITVHVFAVIGVPVSTSQGIVGSIIGIGIIRGVGSIDRHKLGNIAIGWFLTPVLALILASAAYSIMSGLQKSQG